MNKEKFKAWLNVELKHEFGVTEPTAKWGRNDTTQKIEFRELAENHTIFSGQK